MGSPELYQTLLKAAQRAYVMADYEVGVDLMLGREIDEVAILAPSAADQANFVRWCEDEGLVVFDHADDTMHRFSVDTQELVMKEVDESFDVHFDFVRFGGAPWRMEIMSVTDGVSSLHREIKPWSVVHASWKERDYLDLVNMTQRLHGRGIPLQGSYRNSYGFFSYWGQMPDWRHRLPLLKPRVNMRDTPPVVEDATDV
jgi:hypothetical protein